MTRHSEVIIGAAHRVRIADHLDTIEARRYVEIELRAGGAIQADAALAETK
jgi:hypothetical protein